MWVWSCYRYGNQYFRTGGSISLPPLWHTTPKISMANWVKTRHFKGLYPWTTWGLTAPPDLEVLRHDRTRRLADTPFWLTYAPHKPISNYANVATYLRLFFVYLSLGKAKNLRIYRYFCVFSFLWMKVFLNFLQPSWKLLLAFKTILSCFRRTIFKFSCIHGESFYWHLRQF